MSKNKVNILGTDYIILYKDYYDDNSFARREICGYCDYLTKQIVVCKMKTYPAWEYGSYDECEIYQKSVLRHEIVHAFLYESGLQSSSLSYQSGWAENEEMVDWIANQGIKIYNAWKKSGAV